MGKLSICFDVYLTVSSIITYNSGSIKSKIFNLVLHRSDVLQ